MIRIDYWGGAYGNFLKYNINRYVYQINSANFDPFNSQGSSHNETTTYLEESQVCASHFSNFLKDGVDMPHLPQPTKDDVLLRIVIDRLNIYHVYYNNVTRAGDTGLDLENPEIDTIAKAEALKKEIILKNPYQENPEAILRKFDLYIDFLIKEHGIRKNYPRSVLRNYHYATLREDKFGLDKFNDFVDFDTKLLIEFPVQAFTSLNEFVRELQKVSKISTGKYFKYDHSLSDIYHTFLDKNLGIQSQIKCTKIINDIVAGKSTEFKANILEEAWINCNITQTFDIHDGIDCFGEVYPTNTRVIYDQIIEKV
jgi:hypothetical protein